MGNSQVAHVWAQQRRAEGEGSNFFFDGRVIYSFGRHFPIAAFTDATVDGCPVVLFTIENGWGGYTGRHIGHVRGALDGLAVCVIECLEPAARNGSHNSRQLSQEERHAANLADYLERYENAILTASKARTRGPEHLARAEEMRTACGLYCEAFGLASPDFPELSPDVLAEAKARAKDAARAVRAKRERDDAERGRRWRLGENLAPRGGDTLLRMSRDGRNVETSRGASVPVADARKLWRMVSHCAATGDTVQTPPPVRVGSFQLESIAADGSCKVGCHILKFSESLALATAQGWPL